MKTIIALLLTSTICSAAPRLQDYLTTKTTKYGAKGEIIVAVLKHPTQEIELIFIPANGDREVREKIPAGEGVWKSSKAVSSGWSVEIQANGKRIDFETARKKTGLGRIPN